MPAHSWPEAAALKLTKDNLPAIREAFAASPLADKIYFDEDLPGFGLRLRKGSTREVWICRYKLPAFNAS